MKIPEIDCSLGEGGGGALRAALTLSVATKTPIRLFNIRVRRKDSGMGGTHLALINLLSALTNASTDGAVVGSTQLRFEPLSFPTGDHHILSFDSPPLFKKYKGFIAVETSYAEGKDTLTPPVHNINGFAMAGQGISTYLIAVAPALVYALSKGKISFIGGTDVPGSQCLEGLDALLISIMRSMGANCELEVLKRGLLGIGEGKLDLHYAPTESYLKPIEILESGQISHIDCYVHLFGNKKSGKVLDSITKIFREKSISRFEFHLTLDKDYPKDGIEIAFLLRRGHNLPIKIELWGEGFENLTQMEEMIRERLTIEIETKAPLSRYTTDQIIPLIAIASGKSKILTDKITDHTLSSIHIAETILGIKFNLTQLDSGLSEISVDGTGFMRQ